MAGRIMDRSLQTGRRAPRIEVLITAGEAFPALERAFLNARQEIWASFRVFDPDTRLRSEEALSIGKTWFDLVVHTLGRGVAIHIAITDFDPVAEPEQHRGTWHSVRKLIAAAEIAGPDARLRAIPAMHPAWTGLIPRLIFWPEIWRRLRWTARRLNDMSEDRQRAALRDMPLAARNLVRGRTGALRPRIVPVPPVFPATHHQKLAVMDRRVLYIGGLDLDERRYDTPLHDRPSHETWHDVQLLLEGPAATEAQTHLETFLDATAGRGKPAMPRHLLRTLSTPRRFQHLCFGPRPLAQEIAAAHEILARRARRLIYLETQYFRDRRLARHLGRWGETTPGLGMILILPAAPDDIAFDGNRGLDARFGEYLQARALRRLRAGFGARLFVGTAACPRAAGRADGSGRATLLGAPIVYIHSKVSIFDGKAAIVSSANLNGRSLRWDTEAGLLLSDPADIALLKRRVMSHWLPDDAGQSYFDDRTAVTAWAELAAANACAKPDRRRGFLLPYPVGAAQRFGTPAPLIPEEAV